MRLTIKECKYCSLKELSCSHKQNIREELKKCELKNVNLIHKCNLAQSKYRIGDTVEFYANDFFEGESDRHEFRGVVSEAYLRNYKLLITKETADSLKNIGRSNYVEDADNLDDNYYYTTRYDYIIKKNQG